MRTPAAMIIGMVLAPCGLVLTLTATVAPSWRTLGGVALNPIDVQYQQGLWDVCKETVTNQDRQCGLGGSAYFALQVVQAARGLMISSLIVTALGIALASWGVRCWEDEPHYLMSACAGIVIFISGVLSLIAVSWYNNKMYNLLPSDTASPAPTISVGYCLVLGYLGSCMEIIAGFSLMLCFVPVCKKCMKNRSKHPTSMHYSQKQTSNKKSYPSQVYTINSDYNQKDRYSSNMGYSIRNDNYQHENGSRRDPTVISHPRSYINPIDVTSGEYPRRGEYPGRGEYPRSSHRSGSQLSSLPCDSDLL